eukprot:UN06531
MKPNDKYAFVFFSNQDEANKFYDDMQNVKIGDHYITIEFPRTKEEREAIKAGVDKKTIERAKKTVFLGSLQRHVTEQNVRDFASNHGQIEKINMPKTQSAKKMCFVEFQRKTDADRFISKFGDKEVGSHNEQINGSGFVAEISKINIERRVAVQQRREYMENCMGSGGGYGGFGGPRPTNYGGYGRGGYGASSGYGYGGYGGQWNGYQSRGRGRGQNNQRGGFRGGRGGNRPNNNRYGGAQSQYNAYNQNASRGGYGQTPQSYGHTQYNPADNAYGRRPQGGRGGYSNQSRG